MGLPIGVATPPLVRACLGALRRITDEIGGRTSKSDPPKNRQLLLDQCCNSIRKLRGGGIDPHQRPSAGVHVADAVSVDDPQSI